MTALVVIVVMVAGGLAAVARYLVALLFAGRAMLLPWAVLLVNIVGSALGGVVLGFGAELDPVIQLVLLTGVAGGLTTFSTLSVETVQLALGGRWGAAVLNIAANLVLGIGAAFVGFTLAS